MRFHLFQFVESAKEPQFGGGILLWTGQRTIVRILPCIQSFLWKEYTDSEGQFAVRGDIEDEFGRGRFRVVGQRGTLADEIVLIDKSLSSGVRLHAADGHADIMSGF